MVRQNDQTIRYKKQAHFRWLYHVNQINGDNMDNIMHEANRTFRTTEREYLVEDIDELETNRT